MARTDQPSLFWTLVRFGLVGCVATGVHAGILAGGVEALNMRPSYATVLGFLVAFSVSYVGHFYFTFRSRQPHHRAFVSFILVAGSGAFMNWAIFVVVHDWLKLNYWLAFLAVLLLVPAIVFAASQAFVFKPDEP
ncbi:MAG: GtrA family protein [Hyphomonadaceae bacterium]|nr:GtrA family protein [Hyphomonadaceae bacterium]